ncbi:DUF4252 domain-containing protein [Dysgonomonas sp. 521]|uniref:DUF4252 domain-containing protein n=1 Tax=Dysgonomonas sp. 521 TaxID=2302932 RepID=UPI0013D2B4A5|nr:DUF4252 domain-containing protein [Dysgonomonas sp. 521]NDV93732.1 DUF4252 domain-containing protein [Dysgonomonas sp. 521]
MKKYIFCLVLVLSLSQLSYSQSLGNLMNSVSKAENVDKVKIGRFMMSLGKTFGGVGNMPVARGIHSLEVYDLSGCDAAFKQNLQEQMYTLKDGDGYETLMTVNDKENNVRIMMKKDKNIIKDMIILCLGDDDPAIVKFSGKIKEGDIAELIKKYDK